MNTLTKKLHNSKTVIQRCIHFLYRKLIKPKSKTEDSKRREYILNILLLCSMLIYGSAWIMGTIKKLLAEDYQGIPPFIVLIVLCIFIVLFLTSRKGSYKISAYVFITIFFIPITYAAYAWGADLPMVPIFYALIIVMSGVLISSTFANISALVIFIIFVLFGYLQINGILEPDTYWKDQEGIHIQDIITYSVIIFILTVVSWLSNREIDRSLKRARKSERELKKERDSLEKTVEKRTEELRRSQTEKINQLYRFAEFGRLSSGIFHDLMNPLTAVSLNLEQIHINEYKGLEDVKTNLSQAMKATKKMESFITSVKKQILKPGEITYFSLNEEIEEAIEILSYKARRMDVMISFVSDEEIKIHGEDMKFNQIITNLISNSIDSYEEINRKERREIEVKLYRFNNEVHISVQDYGSGITEDIAKKIFEPFFSTKDISKGTGIGLSSTKHIVEKNFHGTITMESKNGRGAKFFIKFLITNR